MRTRAVLSLVAFVYLALPAVQVKERSVMTIKRISSGSGLPAGFPFSLGSEESGTLYISGMPALDPDGNFVPGTFDEEADRAWANVIAIAAAAGYCPDDLLYVQVLLSDIGNYTGINNWWRRQFPDPAKAPARLTFQAGALPFGAKIELQAVAARGR
jgi:2-iminobutanoate/2-iminopropanoate deaminase